MESNRANNQKKRKPRETLQEYIESENRKRACELVDSLPEGEVFVSMAQFKEFLLVCSNHHLYELKNGELHIVPMRLRDTL